jgi:hypothetical protein
MSAQAVGAGIQGGAALASMIRGSQKSSIRGLEQARQMLADAPLADEDKLRYQVELLRDMGQLTPEMEEAILAEASKMEQVSTDPRLKSAQMEALSRLERQGLEGLTLDEEAQIGEIQRQIQSESRRDQEAVLQNMAARGQLGGGAELAARMQAGQSAAENAARSQEQLARLVATRKLEAGMQAGQMAGNIRGQEFQEGSAKAEAADLINRFNTQSRQGVEQRNVGARNQAGQYNLDYAKSREADRANAMERQAQINRQAYVDAINARVARATGVGNIGKEIGQQKDTQFGNRVAAAQGIGQSVSS